MNRPPIHRRRVINAVLYLNRTGCQWRQLPFDFPKWKTVYTIFRRWRLCGLWEQIHDALRKRLRRSVGRICMDQFVVDIGDSLAVAGDPVVLFGPGSDGEPTAPAGVGQFVPYPLAVPVRQPGPEREQRLPPRARISREPGHGISP